MASARGLGLNLIDFKHITIHKILGRGGFGEVFKARHVNWGDVAVKRLQGVTLTAEIQREADRMLRVVSSPYLVTVMGLIKNPGDVGIVMEYFEYGSLKEFENKYMKCDCWARKVKMVQDIALGMNYLHTLDPPIIHRDLKLENVFIGSGFEAKIGDLGLAVSSKTSIRKAGVAGTSSHFPPEAASSTEIDPDEFWDIFTFAITSYELVSGKDPWPQQQQFANDALIAVWVHNGHRPDLKVIPPEAPEELVDLIQKCWVAEPKERPIFKDILVCVTELFDTKYKPVLRRADRAISEQIDLLEEDESSRQQGGASFASDSGFGSAFWGSFSSLSVKGQETSMSTDVRGPDTTMKAADVKGQDVSMSTDVKGQDTTSKGASVTESARSSQETSSEQEGDELDTKWQYRHTIQPGGTIYAFHMISQDHLAVSLAKGCIKVYQVSAEGSNLAYTIKSSEWKTLMKWKDIMGVAVSESLPGNLLVICWEKPYVYQCKCKETTKVYKKHKLEGCSEMRCPRSIVANANRAIIAVDGGNSFMVCQLPGFTMQSHVQIGFNPYHLCITSDFLVMMGEKEIVVRSLSNLGEDMCCIWSPSGWGAFDGVCCRNNAREIYASCAKGEYPFGKGIVYRYTWEGVGKPEYSEPTCIIDDIGIVSDQCLSVTSDGLLAVGQYDDQIVNIYKLQ